MNRERIAGGSSEENPALRNMNQQIVSARRSIQVSIANSRKGLEITKRANSTRKTNGLFPKYVICPARNVSLSKLNASNRWRKVFTSSCCRNARKLRSPWPLRCRRDACWIRRIQENKRVPVPKLLWGSSFAGLGFSLAHYLPCDLINTTISNRAQVGNCRMCLFVGTGSQQHRKGDYRPLFRIPIRMLNFSVCCVPNCSLHWIILRKRWWWWLLPNRAKENRMWVWISH